MASPYLLALLVASTGQAERERPMPPGRGAALPVDSHACAAARAAIAEVRRGGATYLSAARPGMPTVFEGDRGMKPLEAGSAFWRVGWGGKIPEPDLVRRWYRKPLQSAAGCFPDLKRTGAESPEDRESPGLWRTSRTFRVSISYPVLDRRGAHAVILVEKHALGGIGGSTDLCLMERNGKGWKVVGRRTLIVS